MDAGLEEFQPAQGSGSKQAIQPPAFAAFRWISAGDTQSSLPN